MTQTAPETDRRLPDAASPLRQALQRMTDIPESEWDFFLSHLRMLRLAPRETLLRQGEVAERIYFIVQGLVRLYRLVDDRQVNLGFDFEGRFATAYDSFLTQMPSHYAIESLEPCELVYFDRATLQSLYARHICWERIGRRVAEESYLVKARKEIEYRAATPLERYRLFCERRPHVVNRIPQYHLASYVGVAPETLSRMLGQSSPSPLRS